MCSDLEGGSVAPASPLGALQPDLYRGQEGPIYFNADDEEYGKVHFYLKFDSHSCDLAVHLIEGSFIITILFSVLTFFRNKISIFFLPLFIISSQFMSNRRWRFSGSIRSHHIESGSGQSKT